MILSCAKRIVLPKEAEAVYLTDLTDFEEIIIPNPLTYEVRIDGMTFINYENLKEYVDKYKKRKDKVIMLVKYLIVFLVSMVPIVELRGAIPIAVGMDLNKLVSFIICIIGNMIPVPFIFLFARKILEWGKDKKVIGKFFTWCLNKGEKGGKKLTSKAGRGVYVALLLFVGIPIPGTGAWTGTLAASFLNLDFKKTVISVVCGVLLAGLIMMALSFGVFSFIGG